MATCVFDDGWPSERSWHRGEVRVRMTLDGPPPVAMWKAGEQVPPLTTLKLKQSEPVCDTCASRLGLTDA